MKRKCEIQMESYKPPVADYKLQASSPKVFGFLFFLFSVLCSLFSPEGLACPLCKEAISKMHEIWTAIGFNLSIYFMIATPFLIVASFGIILYLNYRKRHK